MIIEKKVLQATACICHCFATAHTRETLAASLKTQNDHKETIDLITDEKTKLKREVDI